MFPLFKTTQALLPLLLGVVAFSMWAKKNIKIFGYIGPALTAVLIGLILSNLKIVPGNADIYGTIVTFCVPVATSLYLLSMDLKELKKMTKEPLIAMFSAILVVSIVSIVFGLIFADKIDEGWKVAGMFVGTYTGGSSNLTAIALGLNASQDTIAAANAADYVVGMPTMIFMFAAPALIARSKWFKKIWPYHFTKEEYKGDGENIELLADETWSIVDIAILLTLSFSIVAVSENLSNFLFSSSFASAGKILLISTISLLLAQIPAVQKLRGQYNLGLFFSLLFLVIIGIMVDIKAFFGSTLTITLYCFLVVLVSILLHLLLLRLFKVKYEYAVLSITGAIADGTTASLVAAGGGWNNLITIGLLMGLIGAIAGNYIGIGVAYLIKALI